jgi:uncharacterized Zn finger protein
MAYFDYYDYRPYVPVAERRRNAQLEMDKLKKQGVEIQPVVIEGQKIARSFWGKGWCDHLESFSDFRNRLPRGRTYVRNGSVCHLAITKGKVEAKVSGSEVYDVTVDIATLPKAKWTDIKKKCLGQIGSLLELLQGRLSESIMQVVTDKKQGLFPLPGEIDFECSCPDYASMCKHIAAVLYGVGSRLDNRPELLFLLRGVDQEELITADASGAIDNTLKSSSGKQLGTSDLGDIFGIELTSPVEAPVPSAKPKRSKKSKADDETKAPGKTKTAKKSARKKTSVKKRPKAKGTKKAKAAPRKKG